MLSEQKIPIEKRQQSPVVTSFTLFILHLLLILHPTPLDELCIVHIRVV